MRKPSRCPKRLAVERSRVACRFGAQLALLRFERGLPEEHVGTDRGAEDRHQHQHVIAIPRHPRQERRSRHLAPRNPNGESGGDISEQHERQRLQVARIRMIRNQDLGGKAADAEHRDVEKLRATDDQPQRIAHRRDVGGDVERIGNEQKPHQSVQQRGRHRLAEIRRQSPPGDGADAGADHLNGDHERCGQEHRPAQRVAELGAGLGIGRDAAWIVVGGAGDQPRPEHRKQRFCRPAFLPFLHHYALGSPQRPHRPADQ